MIRLKPHQINMLRTELESRKTDQLSALLSLISDTTRFRIVKALVLHPMLCVTDLAMLLHLRIPTISHHLRLLKHTGIAQSRRLGQTQRYSLTKSSNARLLKKLVLQAG